MYVANSRVAVVVLPIANKTRGTCIVHITRTPTTKTKRKEVYLGLTGACKLPMPVIQCSWLFVFVF